MSKDDTMVRFSLDPDNVPKTDWHEFDKMTDAERHEAALADPDAQPATEAQLARAKRSPNVRALRRKLNLTQEQFANIFQLSLGTVRDWEQGRNRSDHAARAFLKVIAYNPEMVRKALASDL